MTRKMNMLGKTVTFTTTGRGGYIERKGVIIEVVPAGSMPSDKYYQPAGICAKTRKGESYIVMVRAKAPSRAAPKYFWPATSTLTIIYTGKKAGA